MALKQTTGEKVFNAFNIAVLAVVALLCIYPFVYILSLSLSTAAEANRQSIHLYPGEISLAAYKIVLSSPEILRAYINTIVRTLLGTILTVVMTCIAAYPLSRRELPHRALFIFLVLFTMIFNGGIVPNYLLIRNLGLLNTVWALVLPGMLSAFNIIIVKNFFQGIPESFAEAARVEGASEFTILFRIYMPLSKPVLATISLWTAIIHWNQWFDAMLYITDNSKQVLQVMMQRIVIENSTQILEAGITTQDFSQYTSDTFKAATIIIIILPFIFVYPFLQKYFVKGILIGGVKE